MNMRERRQVIESGQVPDRIPVHGIFPWNDTLKRWEREGMPEGANWNQVLGLDGDYDAVVVPFNIGMAPLFDVKVLGRSNGRVTVCDEYGVTRRMLEHDYEITQGYMTKTGETSCMSEFLAYPLTDEASWEVLQHVHFTPNLALRVPENWASEAVRYKEIAKEKYLLLVGYPIMGAIGGLRQMMGLENLFFAMADNPAFVRRVWRDLIDLWLSLFDRVSQSVHIDHVIFFEDMCSSHGPLLSPAQYLDFFGEGYRELISFMRTRGVRLIDMDTDGNAMLLLDAIASLGFTMLSPVQASAGMDPEAILLKSPRLNLRGGINLHLLGTGNRTEVETEVKNKYAVAWKYGRYIPEPEHGIPASVSWDNIRAFADACQRYSAKAP